MYHPSKSRCRLTDRRPHERERDALIHDVQYLIVENSIEVSLTEIERALRMVVKHSALTRDGIHFNSRKGRQWINDALQTNIEEMEADNDQPCDTRQPCWQGKVSCMSNISKLSGTFGNKSNCYAAHSRSRREILRIVPAFRGRSLEN